jgi:hypothetical protein
MVTLNAFGPAERRPAVSIGQSSAKPGRAVMHRLAVGDDHVLERQLEQLAERREHTLLVPGCPPDTELACTLGQRVGEDERSLLGKPQRRLSAPAPVVQGDEAPR